MKLVRALAAFVVIAAAANVLTVIAAPWLINAVVMHKIGQAAGGVNRALPAPRADARARAVVRPSPDLLYTACVFDVSEGALHITGPVPDSYASVAGFAADTSNFFALNDAGVTPDAEGHKRFDILLAATAMPAPPGARMIVAPSAKGLILFRTLITSDGDLPRLRELQGQQRCEAVIGS